MPTEQTRPVVPGGPCSGYSALRRGRELGCLEAAVRSTPALTPGRGALTLPRTVICGSWTEDSVREAAEPALRAAL